MKSIVISFCFLLLTSLVFAGDSIPPRISKHQLGLNIGSASGFGLAYRYTPSRFMHQVTFLPVLSDGWGFIDLSYSLYYRLRERRYADFNLYCGTHTMIATGSEPGVVNITGGGFGLNFKLGNYFTMNLNGGYGLYNTPNVNNIEKRSYMLLPTGELGLFYKL
ncbi:MAG: hypothetical protein ACKOXB_07550 [Flavobacteriales bacterium]